MDSFKFLLLLFLTTLATAVTIRGINLKDADKYAEGKTFVCGDKTIPFENINDDYCDCEDGSDEPGTSACEKGSFFCQNEGYRSSRLFSSRVNDGICDCCDGSDEWKSGACVNTCAEALVAEREERRVEREWLIAVGAKRDEMVKEAAATIAEWKAAITTAEVDKAEAEKNLIPAQATLDLLTPAETEARAARTLRDSNETLRRRIQEKKELVASGFVPRVEFKDVVEEIVIDEENKETTIEPQEPAKSFNEKWEAILAERGIPLDQTEGHEFTEEEEKTRQLALDEDKQKEHQEQWDNLADVDLEQPAPVDAEYNEAEEDQAIQAAEDARTKVNDIDEVINNALATIRDRTKDIEMDYGPDNAYLPLKGKTLERRTGDQNYKVTMFDHAKQGHTNIGKWGRFEDNNSRMVFDDGTKCWHGVIRNLTVRLKCGLEWEMAYMEEDVVCIYATEMTTPAACDPELISKARREVVEASQ